MLEEKDKQKVMNIMKYIGMVQDIKKEKNHNHLILIHLNLTDFMNIQDIIMNNIGMKIQVNIYGEGTKLAQIIMIMKITNIIGMMNHKLINLNKVKFNQK